MDKSELFQGRCDIHGISIAHAVFKTTGYCGGDAGHGGYLTVRISSDANMLFDATVSKGKNAPHTETVSITFNGDSEMQAAYAFFKFFVDRLGPILERSE